MSTTSFVVPPSKTQQTVVVTLADPIFSVSGTTPLDPPVTQPPVPDPTPVPIPVPVGYTQTYANNFDKPSDLSQDQLGSGLILNGAFRSIVTVGEDSLSSGFRSEQQWTGDAQNPVEGIVEYDMTIQSLAPLAWGGSAIQWHPYYSGASASLFLYHAEGKLQVYTVKKGYQTNGPAIKFGIKQHLRWEFKWSTGTDGYARLFIDGVKTFDYSGITLDPKDGGKIPYIKLGQNFWTSEANPTVSRHGGVIDYDNFSISKKN